MSLRCSMRGRLEEGQPVPELNFASLENSGSPHTTHTYVPSLWLSTRSRPHPGAGPAVCVTRKTSGGRSLASSATLVRESGAMS
jgi:hypothetical protein